MAETFPEKLSWRRNEQICHEVKCKGSETSNVLDISTALYKNIQYIHCILKKEDKKKGRAKKERGRPRNTWRRDMESEVKKMGYTWQENVTVAIVYTSRQNDPMLSPWIFTMQMDCQCIHVFKLMARQDTTTTTLVL